ncbi:hypothetical protein Tco_0538340 [Tanacetum coccineum]
MVSMDDEEWFDHYLGQGLKSVRYDVSNRFDTAYREFLRAQIRRIFLDGYGVLVVRTNGIKNQMMLLSKIDLMTWTRSQNLILEGPAFKLLKGNYRNYIELEYNFEQCYLALTDQIDWVDFFFNKDLDYLTTGNVEKKYATSLTKPKATRYDLENIEEMISKLWISSKVAYDKDVAFGISHWGPKHKLFFRARQAFQSKHKVYSRIKILSIIRIVVDKQFGYGYLKEIVVRRANHKEYMFKESDFPRLHLNDIKDMFLLYAQNKLHHLKGDEQVDLVRCDGLDSKEPYTIFYEPRGVVYLNKDNKKYLMRADEGMPKRSWTNKDNKRTTSMLEKIEKTLLERRIMRSLECFVYGRKNETDYRLLMWTE